MRMNENQMGDPQEAMISMGRLTQTCTGASPMKQGNPNGWSPLRRMKDDGISRELILMAKPELRTIRNLVGNEAEHAV